jgi:hypothetical protein
MLKRYGGISVNSSDTSMTKAPEIYKTILVYAMSYAKLQHQQETSPLIPQGDQKTGCIGEFYAYLYLRAKYPDAKLTYGGHSEKGWDIKVEQPSGQWLVQVKTVSAYSASRTISPIHPGWDKLFLVYLDEEFVPRGFWVIPDNSIVSKGKVLKGCRCRKPDDASSGSAVIPWSDNKCGEFLALVMPQINPQAQANGH